MDWIRVLIGSVCLAGAAPTLAQARFDGPGGGRIVEKPAVGRVGGVPPHAGGGWGPGAAPAWRAPPAAYVRPPVALHPAQPAHPGHVHGSRPRVNVDVVIGTPGWPRPHVYAPRYGYPPGWSAPIYRPVYPRFHPPVYPSVYPPLYPPVVVTPAPVVVSPPPVVYVERPDPVPAAPAPGYWYWCADPQGWYPNVAECPLGWQPVEPRAAQ